MFTQDLLDVLRLSVRLPPVRLMHLLFPTLFGSLLLLFFLVVFVIHVVVYFSPQRYEKEKTFTPHTPGISMGGYLNLFVHCRQPNTAFRLS